MNTKNDKMKDGKSWENEYKKWENDNTSLTFEQTEDMLKYFEKVDFDGKQCRNLRTRVAEIKLHRKLNPPKKNPGTTFQA